MGGLAEWAHASAGGLSAREAEDSNGRQAVCAGAGKLFEIIGRFVGGEAEGESLCLGSLHNYGKN